MLYKYINKVNIKLKISPVYEKDMKNKKFIKKAKQEEQEAEPEPTTKICPFCYSEINIKASRCPNCTSELEN